MENEECSAFFYCERVRKSIRLALETIMHKFIKPSTHTKTDENASYFWLGKTTNAR